MYQSRMDAKYMPGADLQTDGKRWILQQLMPKHGASDILCSR